jgi:pSer/pThr/pTyr-binding forkhead associated (FHA) protein
MGEFARPAHPKAVDTGMANWVLKFISGKYQGGEFPLEEGREYLVGRSSDCALVLVEDMVSRQHAKLLVEDDIPMLIDLGSTNGSFVNGERVKNQQLREGDRILFGTSIIKLLRVGSVISENDNPFDAQTRSPASITPKPMTIQVPQPHMGRPTQTVAGAMAGLLEEVALPDLLQLFSGTRKSGVLRLRNELSEAALYLREGRVVHAEISGFPDLTGEKAAYRVMTWNRGTFVLEPPSDGGHAAARRDGEHPPGAPRSAGAPCHQAAACPAAARTHA